MYSNFDLSLEKISTSTENSSQAYLNKIIFNETKIANN